MKKSKGWDKIRENIIKNLKEFVKENFMLPGGRPLELTWYQEEIIRTALERKHKNMVIVSATRVGKSEAMAVLGTLMGILYDGEQVVLLSPTMKQTDNIFRRIRGYFISNPRFMALVDKSRGFRRDMINLVNGSVIMCLTAGSSEGLLGFGATVLIVDEAGSIKDEVFRTRIVRMLGAGKKGRNSILILVGTPHKVNYLYDAWNDENFWKMKITWKEAVESGVLAERVVDEARRIMTEREFKVWFEAEWMGEEEGLFGMMKIRNVARLNRKRDWEDGWRYFMGVDVARFGEDESAIVIIRTPEYVEDEGERMFEMVNFYVKKRHRLNEIIGWVTEKAKKWNVELLGVDATGLGAGVVDMLYERFGDRAVDISFSGSRRSEAYLLVRRLIDDGRLLLIDDDYFLEQFTSYTVKYKSDGKIQILKRQGRRDDIVDALVYAVYVAHLGYAGGGGEASIPEEPMEFYGLGLNREKEKYSSWW